MLDRGLVGDVRLGLEVGIPLRADGRVQSAVLEDEVAAGATSDPFLVAGFDRRMIHLATGRMSPIVSKAMRATDQQEISAIPTKLAELPRVTVKTGGFVRADPEETVGDLRVARAKVRDIGGIQHDRDHQTVLTHTLQRVAMLRLDEEEIALCQILAARRKVVAQAAVLDPDQLVEIMGMQGARPRRGKGCAAEQEWLVGGKNIAVEKGLGQHALPLAHRPAQAIGEIAATRHRG